MWRSRQSRPGASQANAAAPAARSTLSDAHFEMDVAPSMTVQAGVEHRDDEVEEAVKKLSRRVVPLLLLASAFTQLCRSK